MEPIQARIQNNSHMATFKPISPKPVATTHRAKVTIKENPASFHLDMVILCILSVLPVLVSAFMIRLFAGNIDMLHEYYNIRVNQCHIDKSPDVNYTITPLVFNSTLLYWPAQLHMTATIHSMTGPNGDLVISPVRYVYPTPMEVEFRCPSGSPIKPHERSVCEYMVGAVLGKYYELQRLDTFPCYIKDGLVVGTTDDFDNYLIPAYNTVYRCTFVINTVLTAITAALTWIIYIAAPMQQLLRGSA
jgi:hypothetical protein